MEHDDVARKDLFQVMEAFSKVKDADGKMVGPAFKTMKSTQVHRFSQHNPEDAAYLCETDVSKCV